MRLKMLSHSGPGVARHSTVRYGATRRHFHTGRGAAPRTPYSTASGVKAATHGAVPRRAGSGALEQYLGASF